jgi:restriction system protein
MPPRNLPLAIALSALATLAHPFAFAGKALSAAGPGVGRSARRLLGLITSGAKLDNAQWTEELLKRLEWRRFEELCAAYFEALGFRAELARAGAGITLYVEGHAGAAIVVHCKPWSAYHIGIKPVRELRGAMTSASAGEGVLVTPGKFTQEARDFAGKEKISLVDGAELLRSITGLVPEKALALLELATRGDFAIPTCPSCGIKMLARKSTAHGRKYWGCGNYPACKQTFFDTV